jgi:hypothetical protein
MFKAGLHPIPGFPADLWCEFEYLRSAVAGTAELAFDVPTMAE